jgi:hemolysin activation/secretion protein
VTYVFLRLLLTGAAAAWSLSLAPAAAGVPPSSGEATVVSREALPFPTVFEDAGGPVNEVVVAGVSAYPVSDLLRFAMAHERASVNRSTMRGTADAIEIIYREDGYLLTEAHATFDRATGRLGIEVDEGYVGRISIEGLRPRVAQRVEGYMRPLLGQRPLRSADFERAFMLASDLSGVYLRSEFSFEPPYDGALLRVIGGEARSGGSVSVDDVPLRPGTGARSYVVQEGRGLATGGDMLRLVGVLTLEPNDSNAFGGTVFYRRPLGSHGTYVEGFGGNAFSQRTFAQVTPQSEEMGLNAALAVGHPLKRDVHNFVYALGEYEYSDASSRLGATAFDSTSHALRAYLVQGHTAPQGGIVQWSVVLSAGMRPDRPAGQPADGAKRFLHVRGAFGSVAALPFVSQHTYLRFEASGQWAPDSLPLVERFGLGFQPYLRGYAPYEVEGDRGIGTAVELSYLTPAKRWGLRELMPFVFLDAGAVGSVAPAVGEPAARQIASTGAGVRLALASGFSAATFVGVPLVDGPLSEQGSPAVYFRFTKGWGQ